ncbi:hypothetical protein FQN57_005254 [Myotisia sp. PD_48]|nr:hypothetical protein FQN57_005254 [Myotisia sp. PD_48]
MSSFFNSAPANPTENKRGNAARGRASRGNRAQGTTHSAVGNGNNIQNSAHVMNVKPGRGRGQAMAFGAPSQFGRPSASPNDASQKHPFTGFQKAPPVSSGLSDSFSSGSSTKSMPTSRGRGGHRATFGKARGGRGVANVSRVFRNPVAGNTSNVDRARDPRLQAIENGGNPEVESISDITSRYEKLKHARVALRANTIKAGIMVDPTKPRSLNKAITPTGTCEEMCPEFERVERMVQKMVDKCEKYINPETGASSNMESKMVKRFRRSAAGHDEQLPGDIRTPKALLQTMNYMLRHVLINDSTLGTIHKFVWDRTRSIRNDLSIQQLTNKRDVEIAVTCLERIARFHILSLHLLSSPHNQEQFDHHQEREQLNNTLLSLLYYYDDNRDRLKFPHEDEFRAYYVLFSIQDQRPDLEARVQKWPRHLRESPRVRVALELFAAAGNTWQYQGTLDAKRLNAVAQGFYFRFFNILKSKSVSYLMACVAEVYLPQIRQTTIRSIWKAYCRQPQSQQHKNQEWTVGELTYALAFDSDDQTIQFCEDQDLQLSTNSEGKVFLNWADRSIDSVAFQPSSQQVFSERLVEQKRCGRSLAAVILGMSVPQAIKLKMIDVSLLRANELSVPSDDESLFVSNDNDQAPEQQQAPFGFQNLAQPQTSPFFSSGINSNPMARPGIESPQSQATTSSAFGKPSFSPSAPPFIPQSSMQKPTSPVVPPPSQPSSMFTTSAGGTNTPAFSSSTPSFSSSFAANFGGPNNNFPEQAKKGKPLFGAPSTVPSGTFGGSLDTKTAPNAQASPSFGLPSNQLAFPTTLSSQNQPKPSFSLENIQPLSSFSTGGVPASNSKPLFTGSMRDVKKQAPEQFSQGKPSIRFGAPSSQFQLANGSDTLSPANTLAPFSSFTPPAKPQSPTSFNQPKDKPQEKPSSSSTIFSTSIPSPALRSTAPESILPKAQQSRSEEITFKATEPAPMSKNNDYEIQLQKMKREFEAEEKKRKALERELEKERQRHKDEEVARQEAARKEKERQQEAARREKAERQRRELEEIRAAQRDIAKIRAFERRQAEKEASRKAAVEAEFGSRKADSLLDMRPNGEYNFKSSTSTRSSPGNEFSVEKLLKTDRLKRKRSVPSSLADIESTTSSVINKDELILSAARLAANRLSQGVRAWDETSSFRDSVSRSSTPIFGLSSGVESRPPILEGSHTIVNGYDVALAPSTALGLGQTMSRTEQRIRQTGANGLAFKPITPARKASEKRKAKGKAPQR